ncbi:hypothetical protein PAXRUDRAFT_834215, partial [Paxillus rubicundulus Ve08.2h10]
MQRNGKVEKWRNGKVETWTCIWAGKQTWSGGAELTCMAWDITYSPIIESSVRCPSDVKGLVKQLLDDNLVTKYI